MHDDESGTCGQWGEYGQLLDPDVLLGGLVGDDAGHEKPGLLPDPPQARPHVRTPGGRR